jgi:hypothetical protein
MGLMVAAVLSLSVSVPTHHRHPRFRRVGQRREWSCDRFGTARNAAPRASRPRWRAYRPYAGDGPQAGRRRRCLRRTNRPLPRNPIDPRSARCRSSAIYARERGYDLPLPLGVGGVYYVLSRDVDVTRCAGRTQRGATRRSIQYATLSAHSDVDNANLKFDAWLLPFPQPLRRRPVRQQPDGRDHRRGPVRRCCPEALRATVACRYRHRSKVPWAASA